MTIGGGGDPGVDPQRWLRDMGTLLALPAMWVDHEPREIASGLLSVLFGVLRLEGAYARFSDPERGELVESWRPSATGPPVELRSLIGRAADRDGQGITVSEHGGDGDRMLRIAQVRLVLPWESGLVLASAQRVDFLTPMETQLLRVAVSQAAIAIHTARRLAREHTARTVAEDALSRQDAWLRSLIDEIGPSLESATQRIRSVAAAVGPDAGPLVAPAPAEARVTRGTATPGSAPPLTHREVEVLGLLAQGLSNKEIAGVLWLSDRTVERHVTSLYRKIGVARRSEATAFALRNGVI